jgi:hypothetical protein
MPNAQGPKAPKAREPRGPTRPSGLAARARVFIREMDIPFSLINTRTHAHARPLGRVGPRGSRALGALGPWVIGHWEPTVPPAVAYGAPAPGGSRW